MIFLPERIPLFEGPNRGPLLHTLRSDGTYTTAALLAADTGATPTFARNCVAYRDYWDGATRKLVEVPANVPRWVTRKDGSGTARSGLLVEAEQTNLIVRSRNIAGWAIDVPNSLARTGSQAYSVDGTSTATIINDNGTNASHACYNVVTGLTVGASFVASAFVKNIDAIYAEIYVYASGAGNFKQAFFKFADKTFVNASGTCGYEDWGGGWYLIWYKDTIGDATSMPGLAISENGTTFAYQGTNKGYLANDYQFCTGATYPSSRIATAAAPAARLKDALSYNVTGRIGQRGSLVFSFQAESRDLAANVVPVSLHDGSANNRITCSILATGDKASATVVSGGDTQADITDATTDVVDGDKHTIAISWEPNSIKLYVDGTLEGTADTEATIPSGITTLTLGDHDGANQPNAMISDLKIYNRPGVTS